MKTYQDFLEVGNDEKSRMQFVKATINEYKSSNMYKEAVIGNDYYNAMNTTIMRYQKTITSVTGKVLPDMYSANHKITSSFFRIFVCAQNQHLLGNGATFEKEKVKETLGGDDFDTILQELGRNALAHAVSWGFWNNDHMDVFTALEFAPLRDEETGATRGGVRWWQIDKNKPLRATLYEEDGYTEYIWDKRKNNGEGMVLHDKRSYVKVVTKSDVDDTEKIEWRNYPNFPIMPLWGNPEHTSEIVGIRNGIDAYDLIKNGYANELDTAQVFWLIRGAGGMEDPDLAKFLDRLRKNAVAAPGEGQDVTPVPVNIPFEARERLLDRIESDLYRDFMAFNTDKVVNGSATATQIRANYDAGMTAKVDMYEYQIRKFLALVFEIIGEDSKVTFSRSTTINAPETAGVVLQGAQYFTPEYITKKLLTLVGDGDLADKMIEEMHANELEQIQLMQAQAQTEAGETGSAEAEQEAELI